MSVLVTIVLKACVRPSFLSTGEHTQRSPGVNIAHLAKLYRRDARCVCTSELRSFRKPVACGDTGCAYDSTVSVTLPLVLFKMPTASSCVTPSRVCPLTAMIWSPLFRRPSSAAAP